MAPTISCSSFHSDGNKFGILNMLAEEDDGGRASEAGDVVVGIGGDVCIDGRVGVGMDGSGGESLYAAIGVGGVVKGGGCLSDLSTRKLSKELKSLGPIKSAPRGRNLEFWNKRKDGGVSPRGFK